MANPLGFLFCPIQQERNHERVLADKRINRKPKLLGLAVDAIQTLLIRAGTAARFPADRVLCLNDHARFRIGSHRGNDADGLGPDFAEGVEIPALMGACFAHFALRSNELQERVTIVSGSHFGGFFPERGACLPGPTPRSFPFLG